MERGPKQIFIHHSAPHLAYTISSLLGVVFDIIVFIAILFIGFGITIISITFLLPVFIWAVDAIGFPPSPKAQSMMVDLRNLSGGTVLRIGVVSPPVLLVLFRERIARPFRSLSGIVVALVLSFPASQLLWGFIAYYLGILDVAGSARSLGFLVWVMEQAAVDSSSLLSSSVVLLVISILFSGFLFLPYMLIYLVWRQRLGRLQSNAGKGIGHGFIRYVGAFVAERGTRIGLSYILIACVFGSTTIVLALVPPPEFFLRAIVGIVQNMKSVSDSAANISLGLMASVFWSATVTLIALALYIWLVKPRLIKMFLLATIIPIASYQIFLIPAVGNGEYARTWQVIIALSAFWFIPFVGFLYAGYRALRLAGGLASKAVVKSSLSGRPTILLLRCFALDQTLVKRSGHIIGVVDIFHLFVVRLEEIVVREAFSKAPVVAVANPSEKEEPLGALREYLSNSDWQPFISSQILESQAIVFILGRGNYTGWETRKIIENGAINKVVFVVPPDPEPALEYLHQNPEIAKRIGGGKGLDAIKSGQVRGFVTGRDETTLILNRFSTELAYQLAMKRLMEAVASE